MISTSYPAEWELQDALLTTWPHNRSIWEADADADYDAVCETFVQIAAATTRAKQRLLMIVPPGEESDAMVQLSHSGCDMDLVTLLPIRTNDCWTRDFGPVTVYHDGKPVLLDFVFNGWGLKYPANFDNQMTRRWKASAQAPIADVHEKALILEGGSIESDGAGRLLTTAACLLEQNRNPTFPKDEIIWRLQHVLGVTDVIMLNHGLLLGDDTDSHIDNLARFAPNNVILHAACDEPNDPHHGPLSAMADELAATGATCMPIQIPAPILAGDGRRLPASHLNFIVLNHAVLVPTFDDPSDAAALHTVGQAFPGREIIGIDTRAILQQNGSLHCVTMHLPKGVLS